LARRFALRPDPPDLAPPSAELQVDYAGELNPQQAAAATAGPGPTLIVAGAGTGKTRTLVYRVAYLIETGTPAEEIALLTFTRRAAKEMLARAARLLDGRCARVRGGTFHAFCLEVLRQHAPRVGYPRRFTLLDPADASDVLDLLRTEAGLHQSEQRFPKKRTLQSMFSAATNRGLALETVVGDGYPQFYGHLDALESLRDAFAAYKRRHGLADYDDLLALTAHLLQTDDEARRLVAGKVRHVLVDEYQDVNGLQAEIVRLLASVHRNVTAVGDDAQSIYRFRGADVQHIFDFPEVFPGTRIVRLEENYRSTQPILDLANHVLDGATRKYDKRLFTEKEDGELPALVQAPDEAWQSRFVCQVVMDARENGVPLNRMAVLFRSGWNSYGLEAELNRRRIPFVKYGGLKLNEAAHVKDLVVHLRVVENPGDVVAWNRLLRLLEGVGPKSARELVEWIVATERAGGDPLALEDVPFASPRYVDRLRQLSRLLQQLRAADAKLPLADQLARLLEFYRPAFERLYQEDLAQREPDLDALLALAETYPSRPALLEGLALDPLDLTAGEAEGADQDEPPLVLSTVHSAKGLEFDTVFLIQAVDGVFPSQYAAKSEEELDEERRLLYVALTRAERELYVCYPLTQHGRGGGFFTEPTRFLTGTPEALLEPWSLVEEAPPALPEAPTALPPGNA
jgi:DNA helicase-2/ATP-dependent DNA helicase PcrA